jgi:hypothetical protein
MIHPQTRTAAPEPFSRHPLRDAAWGILVTLFGEFTRHLTALHVRHRARRAGCLRTLVWIVVISFAIQLAAMVLPMLLRHFGLM